ncbi:MAG: SNF7 family protein [Clostridia bacterium]|nr:SNF7 family protein [Clostridia bacterium]
MKKVLQKIIIFSTVFIIMFNIGFPILGYAASVDVNQQFDDSGVEITWGDVGGAIIDGLVGILTWIPRAILAAVGMVGQTIISQVCGISSGAGAMVTAEDIIFTGSSRNDQVNIIDVNFFDFSTNGAAAKSLVKSFREGVAKWYYALRNISIVASLAVLIYIGIRMAIASVASDKAKYKEMLKDWVVGFIVLFLLHYFMIIVLNLNNQLVDLIYNVNKSSSSTIFQDYNTSLILNTFNISFVKGWGSLILYVILLGTTMALFVMYVKRLFTIGFLIVISPLITVTYAIDRLGDGKSQALGTWMKEFVYNIIIQPFHCIVYVVMVSSAVNALDSSPSLGNLVFAVLAVLFIFKAEDIVKKIFGIENDSGTGSMMAAGALAAGGVSKLMSSSQKAKNTIGKVSGGSKSSAIKRKQIPSKTTSTPLTTRNGKNTNKGNSNKHSKLDNIRNSAIGKATSDYITDKKNGFRELTANPKDTLKKGAKQLAIRELAATAKLVPKVFAGGLVAGATGNGGQGIITGYAATNGRFTRKLSEPLDRKANNMKIDGKQSRKLAAAYENYRIANNNLSDDELYNKSMDLLDADINDLTDKNEIALAKQLQETRDKYELGGEKDSKLKVMDKVEDIQMGKVNNNIVNVSLDSVKNASKGLKEANPSMTDKEIMGKADNIMDNIEKAKEDGKKYLNSSEYKSLEKDEKKLAKEIYKSKEVLEAIGDTPNETINNEIKKEMEKGLTE